LKYRRALTASFASSSGGVGKTKLSLMLAYWLSRQERRRVLFMDPTAGAPLMALSEEDYDGYVDQGKTLCKRWSAT